MMIRSRRCATRDSIFPMKAEPRHNPLKHLDLGILDAPDFHEDSVREEIIVPILAGLEYGPTKPNRIIRSKKLLHPFVSIGSASKRIHLVPDYLLEVNERYAWVLEAKAPQVDIYKSEHVEQAYSYAIHSEIRVPLFGLCNGREFALYHISRPEPVLHFDMRLLASYWDNLVQLVGPTNVLTADVGWKKDFSLHLKRLGFHEFGSLIFPDVPIAFIAQLADDLYTFGSSIHPDDESTYVVSFDFNTDVMRQLRARFPRRRSTSSRSRLRMKFAT